MTEEKTEANSDNIEHTLHRIRAEADIRSLDNQLAQLQAIRERTGAKIINLTNEFNCSKYQLIRAQKASQEHRDIGRNGHPPKLNREEEKSIIEWIETKSREGHAVTAKEIQQKVSISYFFFF